MSQNAGSDFKAAIEQAIATFEEAGDAKDATAIAGLYTDDATLLPPQAPPIKGRDNIKAFWQSLFDAGASDATLSSVQIESSGDLAYEIGSFQANLPDGQGGTSPASGKYLVVWKRQADGGIKMIADMFSANV